MSNEKQIKLSETRLGRIELHLLCMIRNGHILYHLAGIKRELFYVDRKRTA